MLKQEFMLEASLIVHLLEFILKVGHLKLQYLVIIILYLNRSLGRLLFCLKTHSQVSQDQNN